MSSTNINTIVDELNNKLQLSFTPGGKWKWDEELNKKKAINANRKDDLSWHDYPSDNMARVYLNKEYLVVDIDGRFSHADDEWLYIDGSDVKLPLTLYTTTTTDKNIHAWYKLPKTLMDQLPTRTESIVDSKIDTFTLGTIFEGHLYERDIYTIHDFPIVELPDDHAYIAVLKAYARSHPKTATSPTIYPVSQPALYGAVLKFLADTFPDEKKGVRNNIMKMMLPRAYHPKKGERPDLLKGSITYSLINDMATKLMTVSELSTNDARQVMRIYIERLGYDPDKGNMLEKNIFATLPNRDAIPVPEIDDADTIGEMIAKQPHTHTPVFKASPGGKTARKVYIRIDAITQEPIMYNNSYYIEETFIPDFQPERSILSDEGVVIGWDKNVPIVDTITCPYTPLISYGDMPVINLYRQTEYIKQATPRKMERPENNLIYRAVDSVVLRNVKDLYLAYYHMTIWGEHPPIMTPWIATGPGTAGGTGKSVVTLTILHKILGVAATKVTFKDLQTGWGDVLIGKRHISLEDVEQLSPQEAAKLDGIMKQLHSRSTQVLNMKGGAVINQDIKLSLSASSNYIPMITEAQRRILALEPAHLDEDEPNMPLSEKDAFDLDILFGEEYSPMMQEFVDHLYYLHQSPLTKEKYEHLYIKAPITKYKLEWMNSKGSHSSRVYRLMQSPKELMALIRSEAPDTSGMVMNLEAEVAPLSDLIKYLLVMTPEHGVTPLSWKWYQHLLGHIQDSEDVMKHGKASIQKALGLDKFTNNTRNNEMERRLPDDKKRDIPQALTMLTAAGPVPQVFDDTVIQEYREILVQLLEEGK